LTISATEGRAVWKKIRALLRWLSIEDVFAREGRAERSWSAMFANSVTYRRLPFFAFSVREGRVNWRFLSQREELCGGNSTSLLSWLDIEEVSAREGRAELSRPAIFANSVPLSSISICRISCKRGKSWGHDELIRTTSWQVKSNQVNSNHTRPSQIPQCPDDLSGIAISPSEREELKSGRATPGKSSPTKSIQIKPNRAKSSQVKTIQITSSAIEVWSYFLSEREELNSEATKSGRSHWA